MSKGIHIVSMDVPYPPVYGGIIDVYYCVKGFSDAGYDVHLHCYEYGRGDAEPLKHICKSVALYKRDMNGKHLLGLKPFIVATRKAKELLENLNSDNYPVLLEGLHCTSILDQSKKLNKPICVRTHNVEHDYYSRLADVEANKLKHLFFKFEAWKLKRFEKILNKADSLAAISRSDFDYFSLKYPDVSHVSAFHPYSNVNILPGLGEYALYHGNMSVGENINSALYLINEVFSKCDYPFIIAGNTPDKRLVKAVEPYSHITIRENLTLEEINGLIQNAQINILPTFQATGIKLKLLAALHLGRWCIVNQPMVANTGLENLCEVAEDADSMIELINSKKEIEFTDDRRLEREDTLLNDFGNKAGIRKLEAILFK